jgi:hypothetical protein
MKKAVRAIPDVRGAEWPGGCAGGLDLNQRPRRPVVPSAQMSLLFNCDSLSVHLL